MSVTTAQALANDAQRWTLILRIEGVGHWLSGANLSATDGTGRTCFTIDVPEYADASLAIWRDLLAEPYPEQLSERGATNGGVGEMGDLTISLLDLDDYVGGQMAVDALAVTTISADISVTALTFDVDSATGIDDTTVIFLGGEAMRVTNVASTTLTVSRGYLGTVAGTHKQGDRVYLNTPFIEGRRAELYRVPVDATSQAEETKIGEYVLDDGPRWVLEDTTDMSGKWHFGARTQWNIHRLAPIRAQQAEITALYSGGSNGIALDPTGNETLASWVLWKGAQAETQGFYMMIDEELVSARASSVATGVVLDRRRIFNTPEANIEYGMLATRVFVAEIDGPCSFRKSEDPASTSRSGANWTKTAGWLDLIAIIATSSADVNDNLQLVNFPSGGTNYSSLPPGYGIGTPHTDIDWDSFAEARQRTAEITFPFFIYGHQSDVTFGELINEEFLKPVGAHLSVVGGTVRIVIPRVSIKGESTVTIGPADILSRQVRPQVYAPRINKLELGAGLHASSVAYEVGPQKKRITFNSASYGDTFGQRGFYQNDDRPVTIKVRSGDPSQELIYGQRAEAILQRRHRPQISIGLEAHLDKSVLKIGEFARINLEGLPNLATGGRGWTSFDAQVREKEEFLEKEQGAGVRLDMVGYSNALNVGRIAPAGWVTANNGADQVTLTANRTTQSDAAGGLPTTDAQAFTVGDVVKLVNLDGTEVSADTETVDGISGNDITLSGNFAGNITNSVWLIYVDADNATTPQNENFAFFADKANQTIGTGSDAPRVYGEP